MKNRKHIKLYKTPHRKSTNSQKCLFFYLAYVLLIISPSFTGVLQQKSVQPIHVLIVTGMDHPAHDWQKTSKAIKDELVKSKNPEIKVQILNDPYKLESAKLRKYDVVLLNFNNWEKPDPNKKAEKKLQKFVSDGGGLVLIHFASGAFRNWPEFRKLAGKIWDGKNTHDPRGPFLVNVLDTLHPLTKGLKSYETDDELYIGVTGDEPVKVLADARSKVTGHDHPMAFIFSYGKGRVFHTPLGHDARAIHIIGTAQLIRNGVVWVARGLFPDD
ncbi:ThuA domain-containing protein [Arenibacter sp. F26102]|uniref:ThuA domain-containing protein n=1 Tax=Arenibacter sp. F26102 TaxID=2926416 RepID=UPI001FF26FB5|nr:ThuA domain-containing protein [Arenibacter sp. F26102]MCK0148283.1 ThuA domain-containing protein [Arenibacter sp. F26102]